MEAKETISWLNMVRLRGHSLMMRDTLLSLNVLPMLYSIKLGVFTQRNFASPLGKQKGEVKFKLYLHKVQSQSLRTNNEKSFTLNMENVSCLSYTNFNIT